MAEWILQLPTWTIIRSAGILSYLLIAAGIALGILYSMPFLKGAAKARIYRLHTWSVGSGFIIGLFHGMMLLIDTYMPFSWKELWLPFASTHKPVWNGLGILAIYGMLIVLVTTDMRHLLGKKLWHTIHLLSYPIFIMSLLHGIGAGTDTQYGWTKLMYAITAGGIVLLTVSRALLHRPRRRQVSPSPLKRGA